MRDRDTRDIEEEARSPARWVAAAAAGLCLLAAALVVGVPQLREAPRTPEAEVSSSPPLAGAWAEGGRPGVGAPIIEQTLAQALPDYVIALNRWMAARRGEGDVAMTAAELERAASKVLSDEVTRAFGGAASDALLDLVHAARAAGAASSSDIDSAADALTMTVLRFNDALARADLGYVIDNDVLSGDGSRVVLIFSFRVDEVRPYRSGDHVVRALHLTRMDSLNWGYNLLGFTTAQRREALVLIDEVDDRIIDRLLPQLAPEPTPFYRLEDGDEAELWAGPLQAHAAAVVRAEYGGGEVSERLGQLVAARKRLFIGWNERLADRGWSVDLPDALHLTFDVRGELGDLMPDSELDAYAKVEDALRDPELEAAFARARGLLASSIDRHEVQHRLDHLRAEPLPMPEPLADFVGQPRATDGSERPAATRARAELSAYLAELARDRESAGVGLLVIAQFLIEPQHWGTAESYAAAVILEGLIAGTGIDGSPRVVVNGGEVDRARVTAAVMALTDLPRSALRRAAADLWARLFESRLPPLAPGR